MNWFGSYPEPHSLHHDTDTRSKTEQTNRYYQMPPRVGDQRQHVVRIDNI